MISLIAVWPYGYIKCFRERIRQKLPSRNIKTRCMYPGKCMDTLKNIFYLNDHVFIYLERPRKLIIVCRKSNWIFIFSQTKQKLYSLTVRSDDWGEIFWKARAKFDSTWDLYNSMKIKNLSKFVYLHCGGLQFFSLGPYTKLIFDSTNFE